MRKPEIFSKPVGVLPASPFISSEALSFTDPVFPAGASVGLTPPPEAYPQLVERFTPAALARKGFSVAGLDPEWPAPGGGRLFRGVQAANGVVCRKWVLLVRGSASTAIVTAQTPEAPEEELSDAAIEAALRMIVFRPQQSLADQLGALPFVIGDLAGFRVTQVFGGANVTLTDGPKDVDPEIDQPLVIVSQSSERAPDEDGLERFARTALGELEQLRDVAVVEQAKEQRGETVAATLKASAKAARNGRPLVVAQTILFWPDAYLRVVGVAPSERAETIERANWLSRSVAPKNLEGLYSVAT